MSSRVPPEINVSRPGAVLFVGRDPGEYEVELGRPFVGRAGELLDEMLSELGLVRQEVNITNVVCYRPPENLFERHDPQVAAEGIIELQQLVQRLQPKLVITLGNEASHALIDGWPSSRTKGLTIFGAKGIEDRRGYFWDTRDGTVLSTLHPAGALRKEVPGKWLLQQDFKRARRWLAGELPRDIFPEVKRLRSRADLHRLLQSKLVAWDIETKWDNSSLLCSGYCGDDMQPYVAVYPYEFKEFGAEILTAPVRKVGHNGLKFDIPAVKLWENIDVVNYSDDTIHMWWALEPDLAGVDEAGGEDVEQRVTRKMTRKGLAFLCSLLFNLPWWKDYPDKDDPEHLSKMVQINGKDAYVTRWLADCLLADLRTEEVMPQYRQAMDLYPVLLQLMFRGLPINETLRQERQEALRQRYTASRALSEAAGLAYISRNDVASLRKMRKCPCCGGGKTQREHCWRCGGLPAKPTKKGDYTSIREGKRVGVSEGGSLPERSPERPKRKSRGPTLPELRLLLPPCTACTSTGKIKVYHFNPFSEDQLKRLLYDTLGVPKHTWGNKLKTDQTALKKILRWAKGD